LDAGILGFNVVEVFILITPDINGPSNNQILKIFDGNPDTTTLATISASAVLMSTLVLVQGMLLLHMVLIHEMIFIIN